MDEQTTKLVIAAVGVVGAVIGAVVGFLGSYLIERGRRRHEDRNQFAAERRILYARFLHECDTVMDRSLERHESTDSDEILRLVVVQRDLYERANQTCDELALIAPEGPLLAATNLIRSTWELVRAGPDLVGPYSTEWRACRLDFIEASRVDLATGAPPITSATKMWHWTWRWPDRW